MLFFFGSPCSLPGRRGGRPRCYFSPVTPVRERWRIVHTTLPTSLLLVTAMLTRLGVFIHFFFRLARTPIRTPPIE